MAWMKSEFDDSTCGVLDFDSPYSRWPVVASQPRVEVVKGLVTSGYSRVKSII